MAEGHVMVIGGAEDKVRERVILARFVTLAGGHDARIAVISTASSLGPRPARCTGASSASSAADEVRPVHATTRPQANDPIARARRCSTRRASS